MQNYSPYQFAIARILTGVLAIYIGLIVLDPISLHAPFPIVAGLWAHLIAGACLVVGRLRRLAALIVLLSICSFLTFPTPLALAVLAGICAPFALMLLAPAGETLRLGLPGTTIFAKLRKMIPGKASSTLPSAWRMPGALAIAALLAAAMLTVLLLIYSIPAPLSTFAWLAVATLAAGGLNLAWLFPPRPRPAAQSSQPIVFFDGVCGLCNTAVDFLLNVDRAGVLRYAPLQGENAARLLPPEMTADMDSMVFQDARGVLHTRSEAILRIGVQMGGLWSLGAPGLLIPRTVRDALYDTIAHNRYRWFGKKDSCRMPSVQERKLFLM
ncbi:MAG: DCC1-like thiol-disulfide oxidoreductase family protein [bacterium]|nr:DCC1-like thiol-disulfide oxidoreductase family protein [bacterium]